MNSEQWTSLIRTVLAIAIGPGSYVAMKGILPADLANQLIPVLVPLIMAGGAAAIGKWGSTRTRMKRWSRRQSTMPRLQWLPR